MGIEKVSTVLGEYHSNREFQESVVTVLANTKSK